MSDDDVCVVCSQSWAWHQKHKPKHTFTSEDGARLTDGAKEDNDPTPTVMPSGDPVLRMALVHAGVITEEDLTQAMTWVEAAREHGKALVLLPDEAGVMQYHVVDLVEALTLKAGR